MHRGDGFYNIVGNMIESSRDGRRWLWVLPRGVRRAAALLLGVAVAAVLCGSMQAQSASSIRLYVFDGGVLDSDPARYRLKPEEVKTTQLSVAAFLVVHPRGTLMWDSGAIPDDVWTPTGDPIDRRLVLSNGQERHVAIRTPLRTQLAAAGYMARDIAYLALSHDHWDHTANANAFTTATWLVRQVERDAMLPNAPDPPQPSTFAALRNNKTRIIDTADFDVFGDGTVIIKHMPGHTAGHQVLYVKLARTGGVVLSGDLYHYPEERSLNRVPTTEFSETQTRESRVALEAFLAQTRAQLWIQHDLTAHRALRKAPQYYD